jgi:hypothetical protein
MEERRTVNPVCGARTPRQPGADEPFVSDLSCFQRRTTTLLLHPRGKSEDTTCIQSRFEPYDIGPEYSGDMVGLAGIEPATYALGVRRSIQLSYRPHGLLYPRIVPHAQPKQAKTGTFIPKRMHATHWEISTRVLYLSFPKP